MLRRKVFTKNKGEENLLNDIIYEFINLPTIDWHLISTFAKGKKIYARIWYEQRCIKCHREIIEDEIIWPDKTGEDGLCQDCWEEVC